MTANMEGEITAQMIQQLIEDIDSGKVKIVKNENIVFSVGYNTNGEIVDAYLADEDIFNLLNEETISAISNLFYGSFDYDSKYER